MTKCKYNTGNLYTFIEKNIYQIENVGLSNT